MSRIGRLPVAIPAGVTVEVAENNVVTVKAVSYTHLDVYKRQVLNNLNVNKALVVLEDGNTNAEISARNIAGVKTARTNTINVYRCV